MTATSVIWWPTTSAATRLGVTKHHLLSWMNRGVFTEGVHYRHAGMGSGYAWNLEATKAALTALVV